MLKLQPIYKNYIWGGNRLKELYGKDNSEEKLSESWEVSVHPDGMSRYANGTLKEYLVAHPKSVDSFGSSLPILIKYIDAAQNLSVQVHPNDEYARLHENDNGKTELWYIVEAAEGAGIYCGFSRNVTKDEFLRKINDGTVEELLNFIPVKKGDYFLIEAGTVHSICAGCVICEIQQSSNVTYRVYDYQRKGVDGKPRPLHIEKAVEVINFLQFTDKTERLPSQKVAGGELKILSDCKYFYIQKLTLNGAYAEKIDDSFLAVNIIKGEGIINGERFHAGDSFFVPRAEPLALSGCAEVLLTQRGRKQD